MWQSEYKIADALIIHCLSEGKKSHNKLLCRHVAMSRMSQEARQESTPRRSSTTQGEVNGMEAIVPLARGFNCKKNRMHGSWCTMNSKPLARSETKHASTNESSRYSLKTTKRGYNKTRSNIKNGKDTCKHSSLKKSG